MESESTGVGNLTTMAMNYQSCCPDSKMVLLGYSQVGVLPSQDSQKKKRT